MKFCIVCNNMYYICIDENDPNKLSHYCRSCGNKDEIVENICLLSSTIKNNELDADLTQINLQNNRKIMEFKYEIN